MDDKHLKEATWLYTHGTTLQKVGYGVLLVGSVIIWINLIVQGTIYGLGYQSAKQAQEQIGNVSVNYTARTKPQPLSIVDKAILPSADNEYTAYAIVKNPNAKFSGKFSYTFTVGENTYDFSKTTIMPSEQLFLVINQLAIDQPNTTIEITPYAVQWNRVSNNVKPPPFKIEQTTLTAINLTEPVNSNTNQPIELNTTLNIVNGLPYTKFETMVTNQSILGFHSVRIVAVVRNSAGEIIAIGDQTVKDVKSFTAFRSVLYWKTRFLSDVHPEVHFYTDYLERSNLIYPGD